MWRADLVEDAPNEGAAAQVTEDDSAADQGKQHRPHRHMPELRREHRPQSFRHVHHGVDQDRDLQAPPDTADTSLRAVPGILKPGQDGYDDTGTDEPAVMGI